MENTEWGELLFKKAEKTAEGAPNILGTPSWIVFRKDERQKNREFILCWLMENCEVFAIGFPSIKKRKPETSCLVVAKIRSVTSKKRNICYAGGFCRGNEDAIQKIRTHPLEDVSVDISSFPSSPNGEEGESEITEPLHVDHFGCRFDRFRSFLRGDQKGRRCLQPWCFVRWSSRHRWW